MTKRIKESSDTSSEVRDWLEKISDSQKREKSFRKDGKRITDIYECKDQVQIPYNILFSNTETLSPALYNNTPRPVIQRRFRDKDPLAASVSKVMQRSIEYFLDTNQLDSPDFDEAVSDTVIDALIPGRGLMRFAFEPTFKQEPDAEKEGEFVDTLADATVTWEKVFWNRFCYGFATSWSKVPWVAFEHLMDREELEKNFGEDLGKTIKLTICSSETSEEGEGDQASPPPDSGDAEFAQVFEIWDKDHKKVLFVSPGYKEGVIKSVDDPLKLSGFYPCPKPLMFLHKLASLIPIPLYNTYEQQAEELNDITVRIKKITRALKVRGFYDGTLQDLDKLLQKGDNELIPAQNVAAMQQGQTLEKSIWLMPLDKLITVLQQLYINRTNCKQVIFDITGIADIMRGSSQASETLGAQEIKTQWGTLRLKRNQKTVQKFVRDCIRIMGEIAGSKLQIEQFKQITGILLPMEVEKQRLQVQMQQYQMVVQQAQQAQQPPPPLPPPEVLATLKLPTWEEVTAVLKKDLIRQYKLDIETNSTVDSEATEDKAQIGELLNAMAQFLNGIGPMIQQGYMPFGAGKEMLLAIVRRYRFGTEVEAELEKMEAPQQKPDPKEEGTKLDNQQKQQDMQLKGQLQQMEQKIAQMEAEAKATKLQSDKQLSDMEAQLKVQELIRNEEFSKAKHQNKMQDLVRKAVQASTKETTDATV